MDSGSLVLWALMTSIAVDLAMQAQVMGFIRISLGASMCLKRWSSRAGRLAAKVRALLVLDMHLTYEDLIAA